MRPTRFLTWWLLFCAPAASAQDLAGCVLELESTERLYADCGTLAVPLDYAMPDGDRIELSFARVPALAANPRPDPLVLIAGGPGQSTIDLYLQMRGAFALVRRDRDIVLLDQRGTGRSADGFACTFADDIDFQTASNTLLEELMSDCLRALERDPRFYTTSIAARDLDALREALGVAEWNLYGVSYGTRVAQHYLRRYPEGSRRLILDGVVPTTLVLGPDMAANAQNALDGIFERCARHAECDERFGDLASKFDHVLYELAGAADRNGPTLEHLQTVTRLMSYSATTAALLPLTIDATFAGRLETLLAQAEYVAAALRESLAFPMHNSVVCAEDYPYFGALSEPALSDAYLGPALTDALGAICSIWPRGVADEDFKDPLVSDHPVLILSGGNDPATPARYGDEAIAAGLSNALHVVGRDQGHGMAAIGCTPRLMAEFLEAEQPTQIDTSCIEREVPTPFFLSAAGPGP
jgi:pimeloyl-ACP methyl ester carboxylesterase